MYVCFMNLIGLIILDVLNNMSFLEFCIICCFILFKMLLKGLVIDKYCMYEGKCLN